MLKRFCLVLAAAVALAQATTTIEPMDPSDPSNQFRVVNSDHFILAVDLNRLLIRPVNTDYSEIMYNGQPIRAEIKADHPQFNQILAQIIAAGNTGRISFVVYPATSSTSGDAQFNLFAVDVVQF